MHHELFLLFFCTKGAWQAPKSFTCTPVFSLEKGAFRGPSCPHVFVQQTVIEVMDMDLHDQAH